MKVDILGIEIDDLTMEETVRYIAEAIKEKRTFRVVTANPEIIYAATRDKGLRDLINRADLVTADGFGVIWAAAFLGTPLRERVTGIDLLQALFPHAGKNNWRLFFVGAQPGVAEKAAGQIERDNPGIIWQAEHGYFQAEDEFKVKEKIRLFKPDLLLAGLGAPRQERWLAENPELAEAVIGVGGSFDVLAGNVRRAPHWMRRVKLEWLYRLVQEPRRWRRQMVLPLFVWKVLTTK
ncbi:MAG TPA: WecB/TagA/CpsF family glycosyltransferase [Desulfitobacteriaceae bacterium]|nr:WecB/TagA/CpsF family glycosyltransferase [Desulfitobacteriaceae bacterium]